MNIALFLDRDGTINIDPGYISNPDLVELYDGVCRSLGEVKNDYGLKLIVISNQSGIGRGKITVEQVKAVNERIDELLSECDAEIDKYYYCPHHPEEYAAGECTCRKPSPELVLEAADDYNIDLENSYFIGDKATDIICGKNAGTKTILVLTGDGREEISNLRKENNFPNFVADDLNHACRFIIEELNEKHKNT